MLCRDTGEKNEESGRGLGLAPGEKPLLIGQKACCRGKRQDRGYAQEVDEPTHRREVPLPEGGNEWEWWDFLCEREKERERERERETGAQS